MTNHLFTPERLDQIDICFLIGAGRSGTTVLTQLLNVHEKLLATPENKFVMTFYNLLHQNKTDTVCLNNLLIRYYRQINRNKPQKKGGNLVWSFDNKPLQSLLQTQEPQGYDRICKAFLLGLQYAGRNNEQVRVLINKNPDYINWVPELLSVFPKAKFIIAIRDYRAVANSYRQNPENHYLDRLSLVELFWRADYSALLPLTHLFPEKFLFVHYEDLVMEPMQSIAQVCAFLDIQFQEKMLLFHEFLPEKMEEERALWNDYQREKWSALSKPLNPDSLYKWQNTSTPTQIAFAEWQCGKIGQHFGYIPTLQLSLLQKMGLWFICLPRMILFWMLYHGFVRQYYRIPLKLRMILIKVFKFKR